MSEYEKIAGTRSGSSGALIPTITLLRFISEPELREDIIAFEVVLCHSPDRLARRYAYQVLLLKEFSRAGVEIVFALEGERARRGIALQ